MKSLSLIGITQNSKTLTVLNLSNCPGLNSMQFKEMIIQCDELIEVNFSEAFLDARQVSTLCKHLSTKIVKLNLKFLEQFSDYKIKTLVSRCKQIQELYLRGTSISEVGIQSIIEHLSDSLIYFALPDGVDIDKCKNLGLMQKLQSILYLTFIGYNEIYES